MTIWIPTSIYEVLPVTYMMIGIAFIAGAFYVGYQGALTITYMTLGLGSIAAGIIVARFRRMSRPRKSGSQSGANSHSSQILAEIVS